MYFTSRRAAKYQPDHRERLRRYAPDTDNAFFNTTNIVAAMRLDAIYFKCNKTLADTLLLLVRRPTTAIEEHLPGNLSTKTIRRSFGTLDCFCLQVTR